jgi:tRNA-uridine 2-sulfurtransferase
VDPAVQPLGRHDGIHRFTIGQRRGLGVALGRPGYVQMLDRARDAVVVTTDPDALLSGSARVAEVRWLAGPQEGSAQVQIRYRHTAVPAQLADRLGGGVDVHFDQPQRAVTPGQAAVFYNGDRVLGGGWIQSAGD